MLNGEDTEILIAYGGAAAKGWEGMTIAALEDLRKDGEDKVIGNGGILQEDVSPCKHGRCRRP